MTYTQLDIDLLIELHDSVGQEARRFLSGIDSKLEVDVEQLKAGIRTEEDREELLKTILQAIDDSNRMIPGASIKDRLAMTGLGLTGVGAVIAASAVVVRYNNSDDRDEFRDAMLDLYYEIKHMKLKR